VGTGLTGEEHRSDRCATTQSGIFEAEDTRRDCKACVEAEQVAVAEHLSDGESFKSSKTALEGLVSLVVRKGYFRLSVASIKPKR
jgi:deoxycytidylate deaminase